MNDARIIEGQAALWLARSEDAAWTETEQRELDAWLEESVAHKAAFWRLSEGWSAADRLRALQSGAATEPAVAAKWRPAVSASLAACIGLAALFASLRAAPDERAPAHAKAVATAVGDRKIVRLGDGSSIDVNTASVVRIAYDRSRRSVWLDRGEAFFEVAHDPSRPFVVHTGSKDIVVLGTRFAVRKDGDRVTVSVVEGRVGIRDSGKVNTSSATAIGGAIAIAENDSTLIASNAPAKVDQALSWRRGTLVFDNSALVDAAAEFNRYNERKIVIADPAIRDIRVGGTFRPTNADAFARILRDAYGFTVRTDRNAIIISKA